MQESPAIDQDGSPAGGRALVLCRADPNGCPRPRQMALILAERFKVTIVATAVMDDPRIKTVLLPTLPIHGLPRLHRVVRLAARRFRSLLWSHELAALAAELRSRYFDLVVCHDLELLPLAGAVAGGHLIFDAREYHPRQFEDRLSWRLLYAPLNESLCREHLGRCDLVITVSEGLADEYARVFGVSPEIFPSLPPFHDLAPSPVDPGRIRLVHHGWANRSRNLESMIRMMDSVDGRFSLDLMVRPIDERYSRELEQAASRRPNVRIRPPVAYRQLIPETAAYDIGVYILRPDSFNMLHALPNKLFEFIQARLAVAIGPSPDMRAVVERWGCGVVASDFEPESLAHDLNALSAEAIRQMKERADVAAGELNSRRTAERIHAEIDRLPRSRRDSGRAAST